MIRLSSTHKQVVVVVVKHTYSPVHIEEVVIVIIFQPPPQPSDPMNDDDDAKHVQHAGSTVLLKVLETTPKTKSQTEGICVASNDNTSVGLTVKSYSLEKFLYTISLGRKTSDL